MALAVSEKTLFNPFPGLRAFKESESHLFFGREEHINDVLAKLDKNHFVAVVGTSGTGKSSLIKAGVLPAIAAGAKSEKDQHWELVTITPGSAPLRNLAQAICKNERLAAQTDKAALEKRLVELMTHSTLGLVQAMRTALPPKTKLLLLIDQFEEVFRFADEDEAISKAEYDQFVKLLIDTVRQRDVPIYAILTLRSDFLGDCVAFEGLPEAINDGHYLVPRMTKAQMKRAITDPVDYASGKISPRLVQHITTDLGSNPDQLPILQHAMMRCWHYWKEHQVVGEPMDLKHFEAIGDLDNALSSHANEAYNELNARQKTLVEKVFKCLTTKQADNRGVRRPMSLASLVHITQATKEEILACIAPFRQVGRTFVLPAAEIPATESTILDISHESLMRGWDRLSTWVDEEMESAELYERICTAAILYNKGASALWRDPELQLAIEWQATQQPTKAWAQLYNEHFTLAIDFIETSRLAAIDEKTKKRQRKQTIRIAVAAFVTVISILAVWALLQTNVANNKRLEAQEKSQEALAEKQRAEAAKELAVAATKEAELNKEKAESQAKIAEDQASRAKLQKQIAEQERLKAESAAQEAFNKQQLADLKSKEALEQRRKADSARYESARLRMIAMGQNLANESSQITRDPELAALLAIASFDIAATNGGNQNDGKLYNAAAKAQAELDNRYTPLKIQHANELMAMQASEGLLTVLDKFGELIIYNSNTFKTQQKIQTGLGAEQINTAFFNPIANELVVGLNDFRLFRLNTAKPQQGQFLKAHNGLARAVGFRTANPTLLSGGRDSQLVFWHDNTREATLNFESRIKAISTLPNGSKCFVGCENGKAYRVNLKDKKITEFASKTNSRVETMAQSKDGSFLAIGYSDGVTQIFNSQGKFLKEVVGKGSVVAIKMHKEKNLLAVASSGRMIAIYRLSDLNALPIEINLDRPVKEIAINEESGDLLVYCTDRSIRSYPTVSAAHIEALRQMVSRKLSPEEWETFIGNDIPYNSLKPDLPANTKLK
jgi:flagellar biosynthesis GTPase FlhF/energy-coupling factor transporter ATP-binding protein EcfA2